MAPYRLRRIRELLAAQPRFDTTDLARQQRDRVSLEARQYQRALGAVEGDLRRIDPGQGALAARELLDWNAEMAPESKAAVLFVLLRRALFEELFGDELEGDLEALASLYPIVYNALQEVVRSGRSSFWDDVRSVGIETPAAIWSRALRRALAEREAGEWRRFDGFQRLVFPHAFHSVPVIGRWFDVGPVGVGGGSDTLNVMKSALFDPRRPLFIPSYRVVMTPGDWGAVRGGQPLGQSGHRFSPYRDDQLSGWLRGEGHTWPWNGAPAGQRIGVLRLRPTDKGGP